MLKTIRTISAESQALISLRFPAEKLQTIPELPLADELHISAWQDYVRLGQQIGAYNALQATFGSLRFPIMDGISQTAAYRAVRLRGAPPPPAGSGVNIEQPQAVQLLLMTTAAGHIPVITTSHRPDFETLVQAFANRNEPRAIPPSMGACMVAGFNNWDRIRRYQKRWQINNPYGSWQDEFRRIGNQKALYQDRFLILSQGGYSGVSAETLNLTTTEWRHLSFQIRLHHEMTHYLTKRVYGVMHKHVLDEIIADYDGIVAAVGHYKPDWFLRFMGLANGTYKTGGRLENYCLGVDDDTFDLLCELTPTAAYNIAEFDTNCGPDHRNMRDRASMTLALTQHSLAELAQPNAPSQLEKTLKIINSEW